MSTTLDDIRAELATFAPEGWERAVEYSAAGDIRIGLYHRRLMKSVTATMEGEQLHYSRVEARDRVVRPMCAAATDWELAL